MACQRVGYAYTCQQVWPNNPARWCDSCFERFGPKREEAGHDVRR